MASSFGVSDNLYIYEYEEILLGNKKDFDVTFLGVGQVVTERDFKIAGVIWRYAITHLLKWDAKTAEKYMTTEIVEKLKLNKVLTKIGYKKKKMYAGNYQFILQYAFPDEIKFDKRARAIAAYQRKVHLGKWVGDKTEYRYPKKFFTGEDGIENSNIVLRYVINQYMGDMSTQELYDFFADERAAKEWLINKELGEPITIVYESPLEYLHYALPLSRQNKIEYFNHRIRRECVNNNKE